MKVTVSSTNLVSSGSPPLRISLGLTGAQGANGVNGLDALFPVMAVVTSNVSNLSVFDVTSASGYTFVQGDYVLLSGQSTGAQNRTYAVGAVMAGVAPLTLRDTAFSPGIFVPVLFGTRKGGWSLRTPGPIDPGVTTLTWGQDSDRLGFNENEFISAYWGDNANDGKTLATAKFNPMQAFDQLSDAGGIVTVYSGDGTVARPYQFWDIDHTVGCWTMSSNDSQIDAMPAGWRLERTSQIIRGGARLSQLFEGCGGGTERILGGSSTDPRRPNVWAIGARNFQMENIVTDSAAVSLRMGIDSTMGLGRGNDAGVYLGTVDVAVTTAVNLAACPQDLNGFSLIAGMTLMLGNQGSQAATGNLLTDNQRYLNVDGVVTANIANLAAFTVAQPDVTYTQGQTALLTAQTTTSQNGPYTVGVVAAGTAALTRHTNYASSAQWNVGSIVFYVLAGTPINRTYVWAGPSSYGKAHAGLSIVLGTTAISIVHSWAHPDNGIYVCGAFSGSPSTCTLTRLTDASGIVGLTAGLSADADLAAGAVFWIRRMGAPNKVGFWHLRPVQAGAVIGTYPIEFVRQTRLTQQQGGTAVNGCESAHKLFKNCRFVSFPTAVAGPCADIGVHFFSKFENCVFNVGSMQAGMQIADSICGQSVYNDPAALHCDTLMLQAGGCVLRHTDSQNSITRLDYVFMEGVNGVAAPYPLRSIDANHLTTIVVGSVFVADVVTPGFVDIKIENASTPHAVDLRGSARVEGLCTRQTIRGLATATQTPAYLKQLANTNKSMIRHDSARILSGLQRVRLKNLITQDISAWTLGGSVSIDSGLADIFGGLRAYRVNSSAGVNGASKASAAQSVAVGDIVIGGFYFKGPKVGTSLIGSLTFGTASVGGVAWKFDNWAYNTTGIFMNPLMIGDGEWDWQCVTGEITQAPAATNTFILSATATTTSNHRFSHPVILVCKAADGWTKNEAAEYALHLGHWTNLAPVQASALEPDTDLWTEGGRLLYMPGSTAMPAPTRGAGSGTTSVVTLAAGSCDASGQISVTPAGVGIAPGVLATITLARAFPAEANAPFVQFTAANDAAALLFGRQGATSRTAFELATPNLPIAGTPYIWNWRAS